MIRDLEAEVVSLRNLVEELARTITSLLQASTAYARGEPEIMDVIHKHAHSLDEYQSRRCMRFDAEVEEANKVMKKAWVSAGEEPFGTDWVPHSLIEDQLKLIRKLEKANERLKEKVKVLKTRA